MDEDLDSFVELWTNPSYRLDRLPGGGLVPIETCDGVDYACVIEDDEVAGAVIARMLDAGVLVHDVDGTPELPIGPASRQARGMADRTLTEVEAFTAARLFIEQFNEREKSDALTLLIHWMEADGEDPTETNDPAQWHDWLSSVERALAGRAPQLLIGSASSCRRMAQSDAVEQWPLMDEVPVRWERALWQEGDEPRILLYFEYNGDGVVLRQVELVGDDETPTAAASLAEFWAAQGGFRQASTPQLDAYRARFGATAEGSRQGWDDDYECNELTRDEFEHIWHTARVHLARTSPRKQ